jgi:hypothetical protein
MALITPRNEPAIEKIVAIRELTVESVARRSGTPHLCNAPYRRILRSVVLR